MIAEGYKDTEIGVIPIEWEVVELGSVLTIQRGASPRPINEFITENEDGVNWIKIGDIKEGAKYIVKTKQKITNEGAKKSRAIQPKDFILSNSMSFGRPYISKINGCIHDGWLLLRNKNENNLSNKFLYEILSSDLAKNQFKRFAAGSTVNNLKSETVSTVKIPLPPLKEQEKIADILSTTDFKIDAIQMKINRTETLKKGLLQKLLSEGIGHSEFKDSELGQIPESWEIIPFLELADKNVNHSFTGGPFGSDLKSEHYTDEGVRVIQLQNIGDGSFLNNDFVYTSEEKAEALKTCQIYPNDIILAKMAEPVARACIMPHIESKYLMGSDGIRLHIDKLKYDTHFIFQSINHSRFRNIAIARSTGTTRLRIGLTALKKIPIAIPPLEEQKQIAEILSTTDEKLKVLKSKKEKYETLKKGLLQKLLSGEVRV